MSHVSPTLPAGRSGASDTSVGVPGNNREGKRKNHSVGGGASGIPLSSIGYAGREMKVVKQSV